MKGYLMQMQPFSVNDGDGIRTTIFLAGCPLHCKWCANPEGLRQHPVVGFYARLCIGCGACYQACPQRVIHLRLEDNPIVVLCSNKDARCRDVCAVSCIGCGLCTTRCEFDAIHLSRDLPQNTRMFTGEDGVYKAILPYMIKRKIKMKFMKKEK